MATLVIRVDRRRCQAPTTCLTGRIGTLKHMKVKSKDNKIGLEHRLPKKVDVIFTLHLFSDVPKLPPLPRPGEENEEDDDDEDSKEDKPKKQRKLSGPKAIDPYANDESSMLIPIAVAIAVFLPTLFCLCKL